MKRTFRGLFVFAGALLAACSTSPASDRAIEIGRTRAPLEMKVSAPFYVEKFPAVTETTPGNGAIFSCGTQYCLAMYADYINVNVNFAMLASRLTFAGDLIDVPRIVLEDRTDNAILSPIAVIPRSSEFLAVWSSEDPGNGFHSRAVRIDGANGTIIEDVSAKIPDSVTRVWNGGSTYLVSYDAAQKHYVVLLKASDLSTVGPAIETPLGTPSVVPGTNQYLLTWQGKAQELDATTGAFIQPDPFDFSRYVLGTFTGVLVGGVYQLAVVATPASGTTASVYATRIQASDGTVIDADDVFNQQAGPKLLCQDCATSLVAGAPRVKIVGSDVLVTWLGKSSIVGARVSTVTGGRADGTSGTAPEFDPAGVPLDYEMVSPTAGVGVNLNQVSKVTFTPTPFKLSSTDTHSTGIASIDRIHPVVAGNATQFLVAWFSNRHIFATRVNGTTGAYLDDPPLDLGSPSPGNDVPPPFAAASLGSDFMVAWLVGGKLGRRIILGDNADGASPVAPAKTDFTPAGYDGIRLVSNGKYYLAAWYQSAGSSINGIRMTADGTAQDAAPVVFGTGAKSPTSGVTPLIFDIAADTLPPENQRTFVAGWQTPGGATELRQFRSEAGALISPTATVAVGAPPVLASDGSRVLVAGGTALATLMDPAPSPPTFDPVLTLGAVPTGPGYSLLKALFDGKSYLVASRQGRQAAFVSRHSSTLAPLDLALPRGTQVTDRLDEAMFDVATNGAGRSLFVHAKADPVRAGFAVIAQFLDDDGLALPLPEAGSSDGSAGASNGGASSSGGASNGGAASGGTTASGGASTDSGSSPDSAVSTGGATTGSGGARTSDAAASGGTTSSGGTTGDAAKTTGGTSSTTGGTSSTTGGTSSTTGGTSSTTGGASSTGGRSSGGNAGRGGSGGGKSGTGGATSTDGSVIFEDAVGPPRDSGGCGCSVPGPSSTQTWWVAVVALALARRRRAATSG